MSWWCTARPDVLQFMGSQRVGQDWVTELNGEIKLSNNSGRKAMTNLSSWLKSRDTSDSVPYSQGYGLLSGQIWLWELDCKEGRMPKNWCLWIVVLKKTAESPLDSKGIKLVNLKGSKSWIFIGRTDAEAEAPIFWSPDSNRGLTGKVPDAGKDWRQKDIGHQSVRWLDGITDAIDMNLGKISEMARDREVWRAALHGVTKSCTWLGDWTTTTESVLLIQSLD